MCIHSAERVEETPIESDPRNIVLGSSAFYKDRDPTSSPLFSPSTLVSLRDSLTSSILTTNNARNHPVSSLNDFQRQSTKNDVSNHHQWNAFLRSSSDLSIPDRPRGHRYLRPTTRRCFHESLMRMHDPFFLLLANAVQEPEEQR